MGGLEICCGAWVVHHSPLGHPTITQSHFPSFSDGQGHRQALQLPTLALQSLKDLWSCPMESIYCDTLEYADEPRMKCSLESSEESTMSPGLRISIVLPLVFVARYPMVGD